MISHRGTGERVASSDVTRMQGDMQRIEENMSVVRVDVADIKARMVTRDEMERRYVTIDEYEANRRAALDRISKLETGPQRTVAWISAGIGCFAALIAGAGVVLGVIAWLVTHYK